MPRRNHIIIFGASEIGHKIIALLLKQHVPVVVIKGHSDDAYTADINRNVALIEGDPHNKETLLRANLRQAKAFVALTDNDVENLSVCLAVKTLHRSIHTMAHVFSVKLGNSLQENMQLNEVFSAANLIAPYFIAALWAKPVLAALRWQEQLVVVTDAPQTLLTELALLGQQELKIRKHKCIIYFVSLAKRHSTDKRNK